MKNTRKYTIEKETINKEKFIIATTNTIYIEGCSWNDNCTGNKKFYGRPRGKFKIFIPIKKTTKQCIKIFNISYKDLNGDYLYQSENVYVKEDAKYFSRCFGEHMSSIVSFLKREKKFDALIANIIDFLIKPNYGIPYRYTGLMMKNREKNNYLSKLTNKNLYNINFN